MCLAIDGTRVYMHVYGVCSSSYALSFPLFFSRCILLQFSTVARTTLSFTILRFYVKSNPRICTNEIHAAKVRFHVCV